MSLGDELPALARQRGIPGCRIIHGGRRTATADGSLYGPDDKLYAHASTTCFVFDLS